MSGRDKLEERIEVAIALRDKGNLKAAIQRFRDILNGYPDSNGTHILLGHSLMAANRYDEAVEEFKIVVKNKPKNEKASLCLFHALFRCLQVEEAFREMERFLSISSLEEYGLILENHAKRSNLHYKSSDKENLIELCRDMSKCLSKDPQSILKEWSKGGGAPNLYLIQ